jgi:ribonuclease D
MMDYILITKRKEFIPFLEGWSLKKNTVVALDIEAELNLHHYGQKLCLVQIFDGVNKILLDPFDIDTQLLKYFFEDRNILKIVYDAGSDSSLLKNVYDIEMKSVLDLRPAVDLLKYEKQDLHSIIGEELGVALNHKVKFQRHNWTRRPFDKAALEYAINDVTYLFQLKDIMLKKLCDAGLIDMYILRNLQIQNKDYALDPRERYKKTKGFYALSSDAKHSFKLLYDVREKYAKETNMPSYHLIRNEDLIDIANGLKTINDIRLPNKLGDETAMKMMMELGNLGKTEQKEN